MFLSTCCVTYCPTPKGKQGLFALKRLDVPVEPVKPARRWAARRAERPATLAYAGTTGE